MNKNQNSKCNLSNSSSDILSSVNCSWHIGKVIVNVFVTKSLEEIMANKAQEIIIPEEGVLRFVFLYVGQGDATIMVVPDGSNFKYVLIDNNIDKSAGGIDTLKLLKDLFHGGGKLDVFMNTHPHSDHTEGIEAIHKEVGVKEVWHSGHRPGKNHDDAYKEMVRVMRNIGDENVFRFFGTKSLNTVREADGEGKIIKHLGDISYQVLSPAQYLCEEIEEEDGEKRYRRIHEHCAVVRFSYGYSKKYVMITGDADRVAWEDHIFDYHKDSMKVDVLSAVHHGSRTFFKFPNNDDDIYEAHLEKMNPTYLIISAPKQSESSHDHPHDDAMKLYKDHIEEDNIFHTGENRESVIVDIFPNGDLVINLDRELVEIYGFDSDGGNNGVKNFAKAFIGARTTSIDSKPMG